MGKATGFLEFDREDAATEAPLSRIRHFREFHTPLADARRRDQASRCMDCGVPFCQAGVEIGGDVSGCPLHNLVPEWNDLLYQNNVKGAYYRLISTNSFPEFTGRVCPALCEAACTCNLPSRPVTVRDNELAIAEWAFQNGVVKPLPKMPRTGKSVAVVGSGPAGLAAADLLNRRGYDVTVYERSDRPGGLLMYGIPNMKLDKAVVKRRIALMETEGVRFETGADVGRTLPAEQLLAAFDAVVLCCGASRPRPYPVPGADARGVRFAVEYLTEVTRSLLDSGFQDPLDSEARDRHVLVVGGGDTATDCVATALRQGASSVTQLIRRPQPPAERPADNPWPQRPRIFRTDYGQEEAAALHGADPRRFGTTVKEFHSDESGHVREAVLLTPRGEETVAADLVLLATGFAGAEPYVAEAFGASLTEQGSVAARDYQAVNGKVFAAGDMRRGQSLVVWAIREGREAAAAVDRALMGYTNL